MNGAEWFCVMGYAVLIVVLVVVDELGDRGGM